MDGVYHRILFSKGFVVPPVWADLTLISLNLCAANPLIGATAGADFNMAAKGFQTTATFEQFVTWAIARLPAVQPGLWRLWVMDGYGPHCVSPIALEALRAAQIFAVIIPSHSSHLLQLQVTLSVSQCFTWVAGRGDFWSTEAGISSAY